MAAETRVVRLRRKANPLSDPSNMIPRMNQFQELLQALPEQWHTRGLKHGLVSPHLIRKRVFLTGVLALSLTRTMLRHES